MRDLKGFFEVLFLKVLLQNPGVEVVVHLIVKPGQRSRFDGSKALGRNRLTVSRSGDCFRL